MSLLNKVNKSFGNTSLVSSKDMQLNSKLEMSTPVFNNSLSHIIPSLNDALTEIINILHLCSVDHFFHLTPYFVINQVQVWAVRGPVLRRYEIRRFSLRESDSLAGSVRWRTVLFKDVLV